MLGQISIHLCVCERVCGACEHLRARLLSHLRVCACVHVREFFFWGGGQGFTGSSMGPTAVQSIDAFTDEYLYKLIFKAEPPAQTTVGGDGGRLKLFCKDRQNIPLSRTL